MILPEQHRQSPGTWSLRWALLLDWLTVTAVVLAACVLIFGGFRELVGGIVLSVRSVTRLLSIAVVVAVVRHIWVRTPTIIDLWGGQLLRWWRSETRREVLPAFVTTRLAVLLAAYFGAVTIGFLPGTVRFRVSDNAAANLMARWDAEWYLKIVTQGYQWDGNPRRQQSIVFFPAFPVATLMVGLFLGKAWLAAGLLLASTAFLFALVYVYRLARDALDVERARTAVWALAAYPFAVYYSAPYTEAFYLLGSAGAFYHALSGQWWRAALWGFFVGLCRPNGFLIALPLAVLVLQRELKERRARLPHWAAVVAPVLGIGTYSLFLYARFGDALAWQKGQLAWGRLYVGLWPGIKALVTDRYNVIANQGLYHYTVTSPYDFMHTAAAIFALVSVWPTVRRFGAAYGVFTVVNILPPMLIGGMMSVGRMTSVLFPVFLWLGAVLPPRSMPGLIAVFGILQGLVAVLFFTWRAIF